MLFRWMPFVGLVFETISGNVRSSRPSRHTAVVVHAGGVGEEAQAVTDRPWGACVADKMFTLLRMYADDNIASMYATSMHSDSGYLVTDASVRPACASGARSLGDTHTSLTAGCGWQGKASYGGYLTWDDHPVLAQKQKKKVGCEACCSPAPLALHTTAQQLAR